MEGETAGAPGRDMDDEGPDIGGGPGGAEGIGRIEPGPGVAYGPGAIGFCPGGTGGGGPGGPAGGPFGAPAGTAIRRLPQLRQKIAPGGLSRPQFVQRVISSRGLRLQAVAGPVN
jgi:hypothetical protein